MTDNRDPVRDHLARAVSLALDEIELENQDSVHNLSRSTIAFRLADVALAVRSVPDTRKERELAEHITDPRRHRDRKNGIGKGCCCYCGEMWPCTSWQLAMIVLDQTEAE